MVIIYHSFYSYLTSNLSNPTTGYNNLNTHILPHLNLKLYGMLNYFG